MMNTTAIRRLNDAFRTGQGDGQLVLTQGVAGRADTNAILKTVRDYDVFDEDSDPHQEHDLGVFTVNGENMLWKIDYYDKQLRYHSEDPANPDVTTRFLTIMLASEY